MCQARLQLGIVSRIFRSSGWLVILALVLVSAASAQGSGEVVFERVAPGMGLAYERFPSSSSAAFSALKDLPVLTFNDLAMAPVKWRGAPGVAILDYDGDGDEDIYVTNGPGAANSLFSNQTIETGELGFVDVAVSAGVDAVDQDSSGTCFGDIDNDGDEDLFVLSNFGPNRLYRNDGAVFTDISAESGLGADERSSVSCSFGDIDNDGLLDVVVGNSYGDMSHSLGIFVAFDFNHHNQLFRNTGGNVFEDVSSSSGIEDLLSFPQEFHGKAALTWAIAMVDYDQDGDVDIMAATDQGNALPASFGGVDRGFLFLFRNDDGQFTDVTVDSHLDVIGGWMGLSFGDLNADGYLDFFATNFGDWGSTVFTRSDPVYASFSSYQPGSLSSRFFFGGSDGIFTDPGLGDLQATPFGWGTSMADCDNDGDTDIVFYGGMHAPPTLILDNPGVVLQNDGKGGMSYSEGTLAQDHRRSVHGVAMGDLDGNGFPDIVTVSNHDVQPAISLTPYNSEWGSPFDGSVSYQQTWVPTGTPLEWAFSGVEDNVNGSLGVELNSGNGNNWVKVKLVGTAGVTSEGRVNRDGIGAVVRFKPRGGNTQIRPVLGGSSYASQDSLELNFGLGSSRIGTVEVLWPGGVRNKFFHAKGATTLVLPEIPCSFDDSGGFRSYRTCVSTSLREMEAAGLVNRAQRARLLANAIWAYFKG